MGSNLVLELISKLQLTTGKNKVTKISGIHYSEQTVFLCNVSFISIHVWSD